MQRENNRVCKKRLENKMPYLTGYTLKTYNKGQIWHFMSAVLRRRKRQQCPCLRILPAYGSMAEDVAGNENGKRTGKAATVHE